MNIESYLNSNAWPFVEANKVKEKSEKEQKKTVIFETGYGPSGLPHIGTFGEIFRTTMVKNAFEKISDIPTKLIVFSDDMDGLRKVPENIPNQELIAKNLEKPLTKVPDPFKTHNSFGEHMNSRMKKFLDRFGFKYEFMSATECYKSGKFNSALQIALERYDEIMKIMLQTLGEERQKTYSPFMPICKKTGKVLHKGVKEVRPEKGTLIYTDETGEDIEIEVGNGNCKMQWKPDFGMRWAVLGVDYEIFGKDHNFSAPLYSGICKILGGTPPVQFAYEMFLDENGQKISKSKGNGISLDNWLQYGTEESLALYMFNSPKKAKRLYFDVIPKSVDEYQTHLQKLPEQEDEKKLMNPAYHIHNGKIPEYDLPISFSMLLNLASACNPEDKSIIWGFISKYAENVNPENSPEMDNLAEYAVKYYNDFIKPKKNFKTPSEKEISAINDFKESLERISETNAEDLQTLAFTIGKEHGYENLREWFKCLYQVLLGQEQGPRIGSFIELFGKENFIKLVEEKIEI